MRSIGRVTYADTLRAHPKDRQKREHSVLPCYLLKAYAASGVMRT